jgi:hypothetical protein
MGAARTAVAGTAASEAVRRGGSVTLADPSYRDAVKRAAGQDEVRLPDVRQPPPVPPIDDPMFHGLAGDFVKAVLPETEADPVALLVQFIVGFGNMVGRSPHFLVEATRHPCNLFALVIGPTNRGRKGTAWDWVRLVLRDVDPVWGKRVKGGMSSGEGLIAELKDQPPGEPPRDKRLLLVETEFGGILKKMGREGNTLSALLRQAWDGHEMSSMTKDPSVASEHHVSVVGHVTPDELNALLDRTDVANGLVNRFLMAYVRRSKELPEGGDVARVPLVDLRARVARAYHHAASVARIQRSERAREAWALVYKGLTTGRPGQLGNVISRAAPIVTRLSLVYALLAESDTVQPEHLAAALCLWRYSESSASYVFGESLGDPVADKIYAALSEHPDGLTRSGIRDALCRNFSATEIAHALQSLAGHGLATRVEQPHTGQRGRPAELWIATASGPPPDITAFTAFKSSHTPKNPEKGGDIPYSDKSCNNDLNDVNAINNNNIYIYRDIPRNTAYLGRSEPNNTDQYEGDEREGMRDG